MVSNRLDPDQARPFVGPDLGPNCLQRLPVICINFDIMSYGTFPSLHPKS